MRLTNIKNGSFKVSEDGELIGAVKILNAKDGSPIIYPYILKEIRTKDKETALVEHMKKYLKRGKNKLVFVKSDDLIEDYLKEDGKKVGDYYAINL